MMYSSVNKSKNSDRAVANVTDEKNVLHDEELSFADNRPEAIVQRKLSSVIGSSLRQKPITSQLVSYPFYSGVVQRSDQKEDLKVSEQSNSDTEEEENNVLVDGVLVYTDPPGNKKEIRQARKIIQTIKGEYGIKLDNKKSLAGMKDSIDENVTEFSKKEITKFRENLEEREADSWTIDQLEAVKVGLSRFANILGDKRLMRTDGKQKIPQEITSFGKIDQDVQGGDTLAETFPGQGNITVFEEGKEKDGEYPNREQTIQTIIHELVHGLLSHRTKDFKKATPFWAHSEAEIAKMDKNPKHKIKDFDGELPTTSVGYGNAEEDFAETVSQFLYSVKSRAALKRDFPERYAVAEKILVEEGVLDKSSGKVKQKGKKAKKKQSWSRQIKHGMSSE